MRAIVALGKKSLKFDKDLRHFKISLANNLGVFDDEIMS